MLRQRLLLVWYVRSGCHPSWGVWAPRGTRPTPPLQLAHGASRAILPWCRVCLRSRGHRAFAYVVGRYLPPLYFSSPCQKLPSSASPRDTAPSTFSR